MSPKRPWEGEWDAGARPLRTACAVFAEDGRMVADLRIGMDVPTEAERAQFVSAAPDMARAILAVLSRVGHMEDCSHHFGDSRQPCAGVCAGLRSALRKAGVL